MPQDPKTHSNLEILCLRQEVEIKTWREQSRKASKLFLHLLHEYVEDECLCCSEDNYHCLPCRISDWQNQYEILRKKK